MIMADSCNKIDILKREDGIGRPRNRSHAPFIRVDTYYFLFNISSTHSNPSSMSFPLWGRPVWGSTPMTP
jgi:hypothetical protein